MPLQNRVTPTGDIIATPHRGMFTGNRGIIHDPATKTLLKKRWSSPAWLTCVCEFRGRRRKVMGGRSWTELFFLDEATAFAAGHRPCFFCRRDDANRFRAAGRRATALRMFARGRSTPCCIASGWTAARSGCIRCRCRSRKLPDGAMVQAGEESFLIVQGRALQWSLAGYRRRRHALDEAMLLTPPSTLRAFACGISAGAASECV